jgi:peptidoglycan hydrolase CwlO-like protein
VTGAIAAALDSLKELQNVASDQHCGIRYQSGELRRILADAKRREASALAELAATDKALDDSLAAIKILREELRKRGGDVDTQIEAAISSHDLRALFATLKGEGV